MTFTRSIFWDARLWESMSLSFKSVGCRMHTFSSSLPKIASHTQSDVDRMISVEFPNPETNRLAHETVARCMMHGPCGAAFPNAHAWKMANAKKISTQVPI
jgi:hypothetical protein